MGSEAPASFPSSIFFADCNEEEKGGSKQNGRRRRQMRVHRIPSNNKTVQLSKFQMLHCTALSRGTGRIHDFIRPIKIGTVKVSYMANFLSKTFSISALASVLPSRNTPCTFKVMHCLYAFWRWEKIVWVWVWASMPISAPEKWIRSKSVNKIFSRMRLASKSVN